MRPQHGGFCNCPLCYPYLYPEVPEEPEEEEEEREEEEQEEESDD